MEAPPEYIHTANTAEQSATVTLPSAYYPEDSSIEPIPISIHQLHQIDVSPAPPPSCHTTETLPRPRSVTGNYCWFLIFLCFCYIFMRSTNQI